MTHHPTPWNARESHTPAQVGPRDPTTPGVPKGTHPLTLFSCTCSNCSSQRLEACSPAQGGTRAPTAPWAPEVTSPLVLLLLSTGNSLPHIQVDPRLHTLLLCGHSEASLPTMHRDPKLPTAPTHRRAPASQSKSRTPAPGVVIFWLVNYSEW
jgi:hypothetical protein